MPFRLPLLLVLLLVAGCRTTRVYEVPEIPATATTLVLADAEMPRTLYASAWGAFAEYGWDVADHDSDALRFTARTDDLDGEVEVRIEPASPTAREGQIVARVDPAAPNARAVFEAATVALASVPGRITFR